MAPPSSLEQFHRQAPPMIWHFWARWRWKFWAMEGNLWSRKNRNAPITLFMDFIIVLSIALLVLALASPTTISTLGTRLAIVGLSLFTILSFLSFSKIALKEFQSSYWLVAICIIGFSIHCFAAVLPGGGSDIGLYQRWMVGAVRHGVPHIYEQAIDGGMVPNYPPVILYIFWGIGHLYHVIVSPTFDYGSHVFYTLFKLPGSVFDIFTGILLYFLIRQHRGEFPARIAAFLYMIHPVALHDSAIWGQTDAIYTFFLVAAVLAWVRGQWMITGAALSLAVFSKFQSVSLLPLFALLLIANYKVIWRVAIGAFAAVITVFLPFLLAGTFDQAQKSTLSAIGYYSTMSMNAYNFWWVLFSPEHLGGDQQLLAGFVTYRTVGMMLFLLTACLILWNLRKPLFLPHTQKRGYSDALCLAATLLALAFFVFNTEMHERYLFSFAALGLPLLFLNIRAVIFYVVGSLCVLFNLLGVLSVGPMDRWLFASIPRFSVLIALGHVVLLAIFVASARSLIRERKEI